MTKQHFKAIADAMIVSQPSGNTAAEWRTWRQTVETLANVCGSFNPRFNRERFLTACGFNDKR